VHRPSSTRTDPDDGRVDCCDEPEERVNEVDPDGVLHADLTALLRSWVGGDVDVAEEAEEGDPEDAGS